jgi:hypothetical protein
MSARHPELDWCPKCDEENCAHWRCAICQRDSCCGPPPGSEFVYSPYYTFLERLTRPAREADLKRMAREFDEGEWHRRLRVDHEPDPQVGQEIDTRWQPGFWS